MSSLKLLKSKVFLVIFIVIIGVLLVKFGKRKTGGLLMILGVLALLYVLLENPPSLFDYLGGLWND